jgi:acyl carrier protein
MSGYSKNWDKADLVGWLENLLVQELEMSPQLIREIGRFDELGVDSLLAAFIAAELMERLGRPVSIDAIYEYGDMNTLAEQLGS